MNPICKKYRSRKQTRIVTKLFIGYVLLICIPFVIFGYVFYRQMYGNMLSEYKNGKEQFTAQAYSNLEVELSKLESVYPLFQNNTKLTEFLSGAYSTDVDMVYNYLKEISPTFSFASLTNPIVGDIRIYKENPDVLELAPDIVDIRSFTDPAHEAEAKALAPNKGLWTFRPQAKTKLPVLTYMHKLYTDNYVQELGLLQITATDRLFDQLFATLKSGESGTGIFMVDDGGRIVYAEPMAGWTGEELADVAGRVAPSGMSSFFVRRHAYLVNAFSVDKWHLRVVAVRKVTSVFGLNGNVGWSIAAGVALLAILSLFYFLIASSLTRRILRFSRHMKRVRGPQLALYPEESGNDELGFLISSYNAMVRRVDELIGAVHRTELLKKEAELRMLQAQIKPHFIYNTLETMRMLALVKEDHEVAEMSFLLGKLLRYSLSGNKDETVLGEELNHIRHYIAIHKQRMGDRLTVEFETDDRALGLPCPRFILQPIVENSILHGLGKSRRPGRIRVEVRDAADAVVIRLSDNGAGIPEEKLAALRERLAGAGEQPVSSGTGGIGLINVSERIRSFYGGRSGISVDSAENEGTRFTVRLDKTAARRLHHAEAYAGG
ncbi:sensor histidine kinase [Cohnella thermotolerans]|uniref:sensor histidine kinase n=1 Tax=Cohnella thermotolerans TaxID=329858 RepID=UPI0004267870|nr:histidine kinase [Cohnella thermotolerans]